MYQGACKHPLAAQLVSKACWDRHGDRALLWHCFGFIACAGEAQGRPVFPICVMRDFLAACLLP